MAEATFIGQLQDPNASINDLIVGVWTGYVHPPSFDGRPTQRWQWVADMLIHPKWGMAAVFPTLEGPCSSTAHLCQQTAESANPGDLTTKWDAARLNLRSLSTGRALDGTAEAAALAVLSDVTTDGIDHCRGLDVSGVEALLGYAEAICRARGDNARIALLYAAEAWETVRSAPPEPSSASPEPCTDRRRPESNIRKAAAASAHRITLPETECPC